MELPSDYLDIVAAGVDELRAIGSTVRAEANRRPEAPELWLVVRDLEGLAGRLADNEEQEWRDGLVGIHIAAESKVTNRKVGGVR